MKVSCVARGVNLVSLAVFQVFGAVLGPIGIRAKPLRRRRRPAAAASLFAFALSFPLPPCPQHPTPNNAYMQYIR